MRIRKQSGVTITLIAVVMTLALTALGCFAAEIWHISAVRRELRNACDAAGLATVAALASSSYPSLRANTTKVGAGIVSDAEMKQARENALRVGMQVFRKNSVCGKDLTAAVKVADAFSQTPTRDQIFVSANFYTTKPTGGSTPDPIRGKHVIYTASIATKPMLGIGLFGDPIIIKSEGRSAGAVIDLVLCLDLSGSMAFETYRYTVQRSWSQEAGQIVYKNPVPRPYKNPNNTADSTWSLWSCGTLVYPMANDMKTWGINFNPKLVGPSRKNSLPGNCSDPAMTGKPTIVGSVVVRGFTDVIVLPSGHDGENSDGSVTIGTDVVGTFSTPIHYTYKANTYTFPNVATMVEAMRGNLDDPSSKFFTTYLKSMGMMAKPGYGEAYQAYAMANCEPYHTAIVELSNFFALLEANTDVHFCLIPFADGVGTASPGTKKAYPVGTAYEPTVGEGMENFPFKQIELNKTNDRSKELSPALEAYHLYFATTTGQGLAESVRNIKTSGQSRLGARRVVILFTDGLPGDPALATAQAQILGQNGVLFFPVEFRHPAAPSGTPPNAFMQGLATTAVGAGGTGSTAFVMSKTNMTALQQIFRQVAHTIVTLE